MIDKNGKEYKSIDDLKSLTTEDILENFPRNKKIYDEFNSKVKRAVIFPSFGIKMDKVDGATKSRIFTSVILDDGRVINYRKDFNYDSKDDSDSFKTTLDIDNFAQKVCINVIDFVMGDTKSIIDGGEISDSIAFVNAVDKGRIEIKTLDYEDIVFDYVCVDSNLRNLVYRHIIGDRKGISDVKDLILKFYDKLPIG
jgi:hypothetical protein